MSNTIIQIRSSGIAGNVPATLQPGELAINYFDGQLFYGDSTSQSIPYATVTEPAGLNGEIQFNDSGSFGSDATLSFDGTSKTLTVTNLVVGELNVKPQLVYTLNHANAAFDLANTLSGGTSQDGWARNSVNAASSYANSAYTQANTATTNAATADQRAVTSGVYANSAYLHANAAFTAANNATDTWVRNAANSASSYANSAYSQANTATTNSATADQRAVTSGSYANSAYSKANTASIDALSAGSYANSAYVKANNALANTTGTFAGSLTLTGNLIATSITTTGSSGDISGANVVYANTFSANTRITTPSLQVTGDTTITGNLTVTGVTTYANTTTVNLGDNIITLNADIPQASAPSENAGIEVDRGSSANVQLIWNESTDKWTFTNDGTNYSNIGSAAAESYANSAYLHANAAFAAANTGGSGTDSWVRNVANSAYDQANTATVLAQAAFDQANTGGGGGTSIGITDDNSTNANYYITFTDTTSGTLSSLNTSSSKLTFNPSTGTLGVQAIDVTANATISSNTVEDLTGSQFIVDSFSIDEIRSAFYQVQIESSGQFEVLSLNVIHDGSTANVSQFGSALTTSSLGSFTATIVGNVLRVLFTPSVGATVVSFIKNTIRKIAQNLFPTGDLGYVDDSPTVYFDLGYVGDSSTSSVDYGGLD
jgi:hypothetical protein